MGDEVIAILVATFEALETKPLVTDVVAKPVALTLPLPEHSVTVTLSVTVAVALATVVLSVTVTTEQGGHVPEACPSTPSEQVHGEKKPNQHRFTSKRQHTRSIRPAPPNQSSTHAPSSTASKKEKEKKSRKHTFAPPTYYPSEHTCLPLPPHAPLRDQHPPHHPRPRPRPTHPPGQRTTHPPISREISRARLRKNPVRGNPGVISAREVAHRRGENIEREVLQQTVAHCTLHVLSF